MTERQKRPSALIRQKRAEPTTPTLTTPTAEATGAVSRFRRRLSKLESMVLPHTNKTPEVPLLQKSYSEAKCASATTESFFLPPRSNEQELEGSSNKYQEPNSARIPGLSKKNSTGALKRRLRSASTTLAAFTGIIRRNSDYSAAAAAAAVANTDWSTAPTPTSKTPVVSSPPSHENMRVSTNASVKPETHNHRPVITTTVATTVRQLRRMEASALSTRQAASYTDSPVQRSSSTTVTPAKPKNQNDKRATQQPMHMATPTSTSGERKIPNRGSGTPATGSRSATNIPPPHSYAHSNTPASPTYSSSSSPMGLGTRARDRRTLLQRRGIQQTNTGSTVASELPMTARMTSGSPQRLDMQGRRMQKTRQISDFPINSLQDENGNTQAFDVASTEDAESKLRAQTFSGKRLGFLEHVREHRPERYASEQKYGSEGRATGGRHGLHIFTDAMSPTHTSVFGSRQRSVTVQPSPVSGRLDRFRGVGYVSPDPLMPVEECSDRIDRLIQRVQEKHREYTARQALTSPSPKTPTRFDLSMESAIQSQQQQPQIQPQTQSPHKRINSKSSRTSTATVSTISLGTDSDREGQHLGLRENNAVTLEEAEGIYSPRRRAVTMGPAVGDNSDARLESRQQQQQLRRRLSGAEVIGEQRPRAIKTSTAEIRMKLEKVRARRAAKLAEQAAADAAEAEAEATAAAAFESLEQSGHSMSQQCQSLPATLGRTSHPLSGLSGTTCLADPDDNDFFESSSTRAMFQEIPLPLKDVEWDKRVYYYHVAQSNQKFREATEAVEIRDCRQECLVDLLGERAAAQAMSSLTSANTLLSSSDAGSDGLMHRGARPSVAEVDAVADLIDGDSDYGSDDCDRSFDWSRDGFGYMEFRRLSRASLASGHLLSPGNGADGRARQTSIAAAAAAAALPSPSPPQPPSALRQAMTPSTACTAVSISANDEMLGPSTSMLGTMTEEPMRSLSPVTARAAATDFSDAIVTAAVTPRNSSSNRDTLETLPKAAGRHLPLRRSSLGLRANTIMNQRPHTMYDLEQHQQQQQLLPRIMESAYLDESEGDEDGWQMLALEESRTSVAEAKARLAKLRADNALLRKELTGARKAVGTLRNLVFKHCLTFR